MKKLAIILSSITMIFTISACSDKKEEVEQEEVAVIDFEGYELEENHIYKSISPEELEQLILDKEDIYIFFGRNS